MKTIRLFSLLTLICTLLTFSSCHHHKSAAGSGTHAKVEGEGGGTSFADAVVINETSETTGVAAEYDWLKVHYPGYTTLKQSLVYNEGKPYDIIEIKTADGKKEKVYFDISHFFGKF